MILFQLTERSAKKKLEMSPYYKFHIIPPENILYILKFPEIIP